MIVLEDILSQEIIQKLGWTLVHFIWQAAVVALLLAILLKVLRKSTANLRYIFACLALGLIVLLPVITIQLVPVSAPHMAAPIAPAPIPAILPTTDMPAAETIVFEEPMQSEIVTPASSVPWKQRAIETLEPALPYIVSGWLVGVFGFSIWHLGGWTQLQRLKRRMVKQVDNALHSKLKVLAQRLRVKQTVQLMESALVQIPTVVGWLRPVILLPASALTGLSSEQLEAILAHELAHIRRCDYLINILQTVVEILGFYHPAVWWVSHKIRAERENCCDDLAVSISGDRVCYARALTSMEEIRAGRGQLAVAAGGGNLFRRIYRLLSKDSTEKTSFSWIPATSAILLIIALVIPTTLALTIKAESQEAQKPVEPQLIKLNTLPDVWKLSYYSGMWPSGMARDLVQLKAVPTPAYEYDESWKEERLEFRIRSLKDERIGSILFWGERRQLDRITLSPGKYLLSYTRERTDPKTSCLIKMNRVEFPVDLSRRGTYTLVFSPKLEPLKATDNKFLPTTCTGRVIDSKGNPLTSAQAAAYELYFDMAGNLKLRLIGETVTKADGNFLFETTPSVRKNRSLGAEVVARKEGLAVGWALWPLYGTQQATITLQEPTKLSGKVVDENGSSIPNANVRAVLFKKKTFREEKTMWLAGLQPFNWLSVHTDRDGRFEFNNIPENSAGDLLVTASGFGTIYTRKPDRIDKGYELAEFVAGQTDIKITMPIEARIEGKVVNKRTGAGLPGVTLRVIPHFTTIFFERSLCTTEKDGMFNIGGLRSGKYLIVRPGTNYPKIDVVVESGKTTRNVILKCPHEVRNPQPAESGIITPTDNDQKTDSQAEDDILLVTEQEKELSANRFPVPVPAKSPAPSAQDKTIIQVDCLVVEVFANSKMDRETTIVAENLLGNKISLRDTNLDVSLRKAAKATAATKDKSAENKRLTQEQFKTFVDMLISKGYLRILMNPRIQVVDGKTAKIMSAQKISSTQGSIEDSIQITPHVFADGHITLQVEAAISSKSIHKGVEQTPIITTREVSTLVRTSPGESLIIGGLKETGKSSETDSNVKDPEKQATEVLFILTPTIITPATDSQEKTDVRIKGKSTESADKLKCLGLAVAMYANDHDNKLPDTLEPLKPYIANEQNYLWLLDNVKYVLKEKKYFTNRPHIPVAYDKTLKEQQSGTNVLFLDGHVEFVTTQRLSELDMKRVEFLIETWFLAVSKDFLQNINHNANPPDEAEVFFILTSELLAASGGLKTQSFIIDERNVSLVLEAVQAHKDFKVLSSPQLICQEDKTAQIRVLNNETYSVTAYNEPNRPSEKSDPKFDKVEEGISLSVTPKLTPNKNIYMQFEFEITQFLEFEERKLKGKAPKVEKITQALRYIAKDGQAFLLGGHKIADKQDGRIEQKDLLILIKAKTVASPEQDKSTQAENPTMAEPGKSTSDVIVQPGIVQSRTVWPNENEREKTRAATEQKPQMVQKLFNLTHHNSSQMAQIVKPLLSHTGYISADEKTGNLLIIDTVKNLLRIENIIAQFDVPEAGQTITEIFEIRYGDPAEIVKSLRMLISGQPGFGAIIEPGKQPVVLIPEPRRNWIIAKASAEDMKQIGEWIARLDREEPAKKDYEVVAIRYTDVTELADRLNESIRQIPGLESQAGVLLQPLEKAGQIIIFGSDDKREMVKKLIAEIDIPSGEFETRVFKLKYSDPNQIKENIDNLYGGTAPGGSARYYYYRYGRGSQPSGADTVKVISYPKLKQVTVIASPENMLKIAEQIKEWDVPLDVDKLKPRIIELQNSDAAQMAELLKSLFTEEGGRGLNIQDILIDRGIEIKQKIVEPLYGQLIFEEVPGTNKLIVISNIPEAYDVIEEFIFDLDRREMTPEDMKQIIRWIKKLDREEPAPASLEQIKQQIIKQHKILKMRQDLTLTPDVPLITNTFIDAELPQVLQDIGSMAGIPIIPDEKVVGLVTAELKDVPLEKALDIVLAGTPYDVKKTPYYYLVASAVEPLETQKRVDSAKKLSNLGHALLIYANDHEDKYPDSPHELRGYLKTEDFAWTRQNVEYLAHGKTVSVRPDTVIAYDKTLLTARKGTNVLFNDSHVDFVKPERLKELGISATEIQIETRILLVREDFLQSIGLDANSVHSSDAWSEHLLADFAAEPNTGTYSLILDDLHISFLLKAVQTHQGSKMLAAPQVLCQKGKTASIGILTESYYVLGYTEPNDPSDEPEPKKDKVEIGTRIWLKPELTPDNEKIKLDFKIEFRQLLGYEERKYKGKYIYLVPRTEVVSTEMPCLIPDGKTLLIGGQKITDKVSAAPILSRLPVIGELFRSRDKTREQRILLILVKPIINPQQKASKILPGQADSEEHIKHLRRLLEKKLKPLPSQNSTLLRFVQNDTGGRAPR